MNTSSVKTARLALAAACVISIGISSTAHSATWVAICNDGQNIQYNQTVKGSGMLYMKVKDSKGRLHTWQVAKLDQSFYNGTAICGSVTGNGIGNAATGGNPITQVCANKSRKTIYLKYKHPYEVRPFESAEFCSADITIR